MLSKEHASTEAVINRSVPRLIDATNFCIVFIAYNALLLINQDQLQEKMLIFSLSENNGEFCRYILQLM